MSKINYKNSCPAKLQRSGGFTLIELLLVVAIVTLISSVFFYSSSEARKKAEDAHMAEESRQVSVAIQIYADDKGHVPFNTIGSATSGKAYNESEPEYTEMLESLVTDGYISEIPTSPSRDSYYYGYSEDKKRSYFIVKKNKGEDICEVIGEGNDEDSCPVILDEENVEYFTSNGYSIIDLSDGRTLYFNFVSANQNCGANIIVSFDDEISLTYTGLGGWSNCSGTLYDGNTAYCSCDGQSASFIDFVDIKLLNVVAKTVEIVFYQVMP